MGESSQVDERDVRALVGLLAELTSLERPDQFRARALPGLRELVPCDVLTYNEVEFAAGRMIAAEDPLGSMPANAPEKFVRFGHQNPIVARYQHTRDGRPRMWTDFLTRRELHATELYREIYRPMGIEYQLAFCLPAPAELVIGLAFNRGTRNFEERDRTLLNLVRGPMIQAYRTVERYAAVLAQMEALERGLERRGSGIIVLERTQRGLRPARVSGQAAAALAITATPSGLPDSILRWIEALGAPQERDEKEPPLMVAGSDGRTVALRFLPARRPGEADAVLVEPTAEPLSLASLQAAGLTPRESEVLRLVAFGHADDGIARMLGVSRRTVHKHLENVYDKLGVSSRMQAVATAWSIERGAPIVEPTAAHDAAAG